MVICTARQWPLSSALRLQDPSLPYHPSRTAPPALCLSQRTCTTICRSRPLRLSFLSPPFHHSTSSHDPFKAQRKARVYPPLLYGARVNLSAQSASSSALDARSSFRQRDRGTTTVRPGFLANFKARGHGRPTGSPSRVKPLVAEEKGIRAVRRLIENSIHLLMDHISTAGLCRAVLPDAHCHSGGEIVDCDRDRGTPHSQLRQPDWTAKQTNGYLEAHIHPQSVTLILCAARAHRSFLHLQTKSLPASIPDSMTALTFSMAASLRLYKPAS